MKLDAVDYIKKPFNVDEFREVLARVMRKKGLARTPEEQLHRVIGDTIRNLRKEKDLTLKQMARRTGPQRLAALADRARRVVGVDLVALQDRDAPSSRASRTSSASTDRFRPRGPTRRRWDLASIRRTPRAIGRGIFSARCLWRAERPLSSTRWCGSTCFVW